MITLPANAAMSASLNIAPLRLPDLRAARPRWARSYLRALVLGDAAAAGAVGLGMWLSSAGNSTSELRRQWLLLLVPMWVAMCWGGRAYQHRFLGEGTEEYRRVLYAGLRLIGVWAVLSYALRLDISRAWTGFALPATIALSLVVRFVVRRHLARARAASKARHRVVVIGRPEAAARLMEQLSEDRRHAWEVVAGCVEDRTRLQDAIVAVRSGEADTVAVAADSGLSPAELRELGWQLNDRGVDMILSTDLMEIAGPRLHMRAVSGQPLLHVSTPELRGPRKVAKTAMDRGIALLLLVLLSPLLLVVALIVRLDSEGPALFRQERVGRLGKTFTLIKFRSMTVDAEARLIDLRDHNESDGLLFKVRNDPRITRVGRYLRKFSIDELPQLFNVLAGDMSLVGPRPPLASEVAQYGPAVRRRLLVKPGLTGLWQVSGRSDLSWEQSVRLDLSYVENWSVLLDLTILARTVGAVLRGSGSY